MPEPAPRMYLVPVAGPAIDTVELAPKPTGATIGRHGDCDVLLPSDADRVSRFHARLDCRDGIWSIVDLNSRWGTTVNGVKLAAELPVTLREGDLIRLSPFTFLFSSTSRRRGLQAMQDTGHTMVRTLGGGSASTIGSSGVVDQMLYLLLNSAEQVHAATDEVMLAERLMDAAIVGSGLNNAAVLRPSDREGHYEVIASRFASAREGETLRFSQSLIDAAADGQAAELSGGDAQTDDVSRSIVQMGIGSALCVPLMIGSGEAGESIVAAYLYLDSRGMLAATLRPQARDFCVALGRMASLSLANMKRLDIERRQARLESEIKAAAKMQAWMLPKRNTTIGLPGAQLVCIGESRFGQTMGGDFFDLIDLGDGKVAVTIGDVTGKGVTASVMQSATHGYLHAALRDSGCPREAVIATDAFIAPRRPIGKFVTAWVGVIDLKHRLLRYVDAGHGYAIIQTPDGHCEVLQGGGGPPIGLIDEATYELAEIAMPADSRLLLMSDGIVEQFGAVPTIDGKPAREQFEISRVVDCLLKAKEEADPVNCLFDALIKHAGSRQLGDDATIVWVRT